MVGCSVVSGRPHDTPDTSRLRRGRPLTTLQPTKAPPEVQNWGPGNFSGSPRKCFSSCTLNLSMRLFGDNTRADLQFERLTPLLRRCGRGSLCGQYCRILGLTTQQQPFPGCSLGAFRLQPVWPCCCCFGLAALRSV
jgi:hypothetical protein